MIKLSQSEAWVSQPLLCKLLKWTVLVILVLTLLVVVLYVVASQRNVSDDQLLALIHLCLVLSLLLVISSVYGVILDLFIFLRRRRPGYLIGVLLYAIIIILAALLALGAAFILNAAGGNIDRMGT